MPTDMNHTGYGDAFQIGAEPPFVPPTVDRPRPRQEGGGAGGGLVGPTAPIGNFGSTYTSGTGQGGNSSLLPNTGGGGGVLPPTPWLTGVNPPGMPPVTSDVDGPGGVRPPTPPAPPMMGGDPATGGYAPRSPMPGTGFRDLGGPTYTAGAQSPVQIMDYLAGYSTADRDAINRQVQQDELVESRLAALLRGDSRYIQDARLSGREAAAARGMLTGSIAAGSAERAAMQAAQPIASQDAAWYGQTARDNMNATNADLMADQSNIAELFGQTMGIRANLDEAEVSRGFQSGEAAADRQFRGDEASLDRAANEWGQNEDRFFRGGESALDRSFTGTQNQIERDWRTGEAGLDRTQQRDLEVLQQQNQRTMAYFQMASNREMGLADAIASIYSNPNLKADQQTAAVNNARAVFSSIANSIDSTLAQGVPNVFLNPGPVNPTPPPP